MKITRDRTPICEVTDGAMGFSVHHVVSRTVRDSAAMLDATDGPQPGDPFTHPRKERPFLEEVSRSPGKLRIAWTNETPSGRPMGDEMIAATPRTVETLKALGHEVFEMGLLAQRGYDGGRRVSGQQALWGWQTLRLINIQILERFQAFDVFLTPTMSYPSPRIDWLDPLTVDVKEFDKRQAATYGTTPPFNFTGQPSLSLPLWQSEAGLPLGMMFTGRFGDEATLYRLAGQLEKELPWIGRKPPVWN